MLKEPDITLDIVTPMGQGARFYKDEKTGDMVEISFVGSKDTVVKKVQPKHMAQFREEWNAYCDGRPPKRRAGTPLTDIPGVDALRAEHFIRANIHNAEELAALNDGQCQSVGHGTMTVRKEAQQLLNVRGMKAAKDALDKITEASKAVTAAPAEVAPDITEMKAEIAELKTGVAAILAALAEMKPKKPGRPPKQQAG